MAAVTEVNRFAIGDLWPDLVIQIDVPPSVSVARLGDDVDRVESAGDAFHGRVRQAYAEMAARSPDSWVVVDGTRTIDEVADAVRSAVRVRLSR